MKCIDYQIISPSNQNQPYIPNTTQTQQNVTKHNFV